MKNSKSPQELVKLLKGRGMVFEDESKAEHLLNYVNYYKLRAYFIPFDLKTHNQSPDHKFPGTKFSDVFQLYRFDRKLRLIVCDMMERFEVAVRTQWALEVSQETGDPQAHPKPEQDPHQHLCGDQQPVHCQGDNETPDL